MRDQTIYPILINSLYLERSLAHNTQQTGVSQYWIHIRQKACALPVYKSLPGIIHILLDTFHYNCESITNGVMNAGAPLITMSGRAMVSSMRGTIISLLQTYVHVYHYFKQFIEQCQMPSTMSSSIDYNYLVRKVVLFKLLKHIQ